MSDSEDTTLCASEALCVTETEAIAVRLGATETYHIMADAMPQIVWSALADGRREYFNQRWFEHTGQTPNQSRGCRQG